MGEVGVLKREIAETIRRRMQGDTRDAATTFGVTVAAVSESLADLIFVAAKDEAHGRDLLNFTMRLIESRWRELAAKEPAA